MSDTQATSFESVNLSDNSFGCEVDQLILQRDLVVPKDLTAVAQVTACPPRCPDESLSLCDMSYECEADQLILQRDLVVPKDVTDVAQVAACPPRCPDVVPKDLTVGAQGASCPPRLPCDSKVPSNARSPASVFEPSPRQHGVAAAEGLVQGIATQLIEIQGFGLLRLMHSYLHEHVAVHELMQNLLWAEQNYEHQQRKSEALKRHTQTLKATIMLAKAQLTEGRQAVKGERDEIDEPPTDAGSQRQAKISLEKRLELLKAELKRDQEMLGARFERQDVCFQQWLHAANKRLTRLHGGSCAPRGPDLRLRKLLTQRMAELEKAREQTKCIELCVEAKRVAWHALQQQHRTKGCCGCEVPRSRDAADGVHREGVRVAGSEWIKVACSEVKRAIEILADVPPRPQRSQRS